MPKARTELPIPRKPKGEVPHLFGRGMRDRLLMMLAVHDRPLYVTEIALTLASDVSKVRKTLHVLHDMGIVADAWPRENCRYVALNAAFPAYLPLLRLLRVLEQRWPQPRLGKPARTAERVALRGLNIVGNSEVRDLDNLFYSPPRTRALLTIAAMVTTDVTDIERTLGLDRRSAWNVVNALQREGVIRSVLRGRRRALELDPDYPAAPELRRFLRRLVVVTEEYEGLARLSTRRPDGPRFVTDR